MNEMHYYVGYPARHGIGGNHSVCGLQDVGRSNVLEKVTCPKCKEDPEYISRSRDGLPSGTYKTFRKCTLPLLDGSGEVDVAAGTRGELINGCVTYNECTTGSYILPDGQKVIAWPFGMCHDPLEVEARITRVQAELDELFALRLELMS